MTPEARDPQPQAGVVVPRDVLVRIEKKLDVCGWPTDAKAVRSILDAAPASPPPSQGEREAVARIIDPEAFAVLEDYEPPIVQRHRAEHQAAALSKADAILAAISLPVQKGATCSGCEGRPAPENNPCAVCGKYAARPDLPVHGEPVAWRGRYDDEGLTNWYFGPSRPGTGRNRSMMKPVEVQALGVIPTQQQEGE